MITKVPTPENPPLLRPRGRDLSALRKGEVFKGAVVRDLGKGEILVQAGGKTFRVATDMSLKEGGTYEFRVRTAAWKDGLPVLERAAAKEPLQEAAARRLQGVASVLGELTSAVRAKGISPRTSALLGNLTRALQGLVHQDGPGDAERWLSRSVTEGGMFWENRVAKYLLQGARGGRGAWRDKLGNDIKGMLLELQGSLRKEKGDSPEIDAVCRKTDEAVDLIQRAQLENQQYLGDEGGWSFILPLRVEEGFREVEFFLRRDRKKGEIRFSLLMDYSSLGEVEVGGSVLEPGITVNFRVKDQETADWVRSNLPLLAGALREKGFMPGPLGCVVGGTAPVGGGVRPRGRQLDSVHLVI
jgi:hypothetical protein